MMNRTSCVAVLVISLAGGAIFFSSVAEAQRGQVRSPVDRRRSPQQGFWANQRASLSMNHARGFSRDLYRQSRSAQIVQPQIARSEATRMRNNVNFARQEMAIVKQEFASQPEVATYVAEIEDHLGKVEAEYIDLEAACSGEDVDEGAIMESTNEIVKELELAIAEHQALLRHLEIQLLEAQEETDPAVSNN